MNLKEVFTKDRLKMLLPFVAGVVLTIVMYPSASIASKAYEKAKTEFTQQLTVIKNQYEVENYKQQKTYEEQISLISRENNQKELQLKEKIASLNTELTTLSKKTRTEIVKITRPDGTVEEHTITDTSEDSITQRIAEMEKESEQKVKEEITKLKEENIKKEEKLVTEYVKVITTLEHSVFQQSQEIETLKKKESVTTINPKALGAEAGIVYDLQYRVGINYTVLGPIYIGAQLDSDFKSKFRPGLTLGIRF